MAIGFRVRVRKRGPILEGRADHVMDEAARHVESDVGDEAYDAVQKQLATNLKRPTGRYQSNIRAVRRGSLVEVDDSGIIYGPWLEGVGSRNAPVTRFKGYHSFRRAFQQVEREAEGVADNVVDRYVRRID